MPKKGYSTLPVKPAPGKKAKGPGKKTQVGGRKTAGGLPGKKVAPGKGTPRRSYGR